MRLSPARGSPEVSLEHRAGTTGPPKVEGNHRQRDLGRVHVYFVVLPRAGPSFAVTQSHFEGVGTSEAAFHRHFSFAQVPPGLFWVAVSPQ